MSEKKLLGRQMYAPNILASKLISQWKKHLPNLSISDIINDCITLKFIPKNPELRNESEQIIYKMQEGEDIENYELREALARAVYVLRNHPVASSNTLEQILIHFRTGRGHELRYDYINIVDTKQDEILHHINEAIYTLDDNFTLSMREFGERLRDIFAHWQKLRHYSETYIALSTIIACKKIYFPLDEFITLDLIKCLDTDIASKEITLEGKYSPTNVSLNDKAEALKYDVCVYQCDSGYAWLANDGGFERMPNEFKKLESELINHTDNFKSEQEKYDFYNSIEKRGRIMLKRVSVTSK